MVFKRDNVMIILYAVNIICVHLVGLCMRETDERTRRRM